MTNRKLLLLVLLFSIEEMVLCTNVTRWIESPRLTDWGTWKEEEMCPPNSMVSGINLKIEPSLGYAGDDTGLNGIKLTCTTMDGLDAADIVSGEGPMGFYRGKKYCKSGFATGFQLRSEPNRRRGDDTAAVDMKLLCTPSHTNGKTTELIGGGVLTFGEWTEQQNCPPQTAICGIRTQIEAEQGNGDDSSLNNVDLACCPMLAEMMPQVPT